MSDAQPPNPRPSAPDAPATPPRATGFKAAAPNALTVLRLALAAAFVAILSAYRTAPQGAPAETSTLLIAAAVLFAVAAATDALDGHLARRWNAVSAFGRVMDPFADKFLVLGAFVLLAGAAFAAPDPDTPGRIRQLTGVLPWMAVVILGRELLVTSLRGVVEGAGGDFSASAAGKAKMVAQSAAVPLVLVLVAVPGWRDTFGRWLLPALAWAVTLITIWSAVPYLTRARAALARRDA